MKNFGSEYPNIRLKEMSRTTERKLEGDELLEFMIRSGMPKSEIAAAKKAQDAGNQVRLA